MPDGDCLPVVLAERLPEMVVVVVPDLPFRMLGPEPFQARDLLQVRQGRLPGGHEAAHASRIAARSSSGVRPERVFPVPFSG